MFAIHRCRCFCDVLSPSFFNTGQSCSSSWDANWRFDPEIEDRLLSASKDRDMCSSRMWDRVLLSSRVSPSTIESKLGKLPLEPMALVSSNPTVKLCSESPFKLPITVSVSRMELKLGKLPLELWASLRSLKSRPDIGVCTESRIVFGCSPSFSVSVSGMLKKANRRLQLREALCPHHETKK